MIPPDVANSLRLVIPDQQSVTNAQSQPVAPAQRIADVLSNLVPGQRIMAEIQALLPNGTYRAVVGQRDITLALPFSAKPGDTLELEVTESDGQLTLAFVANRSPGNKAAAAPPESVSTSLSTAGKVIGNLLTPLESEGKQAAPAALNRNQPLVEVMPKGAADLAPALKQALTQSGIFYEAHQARWATGQLPTAALLQEPQGKLSPAPLNAPEFINRASNFSAVAQGNGAAPEIGLGSLNRPAPPATPAGPSPSATTSALLSPNTDAQLQATRQTTGKLPAGNVTATVNQKFGEKLAEGSLERSATTAALPPQMATSTSPSAVPTENPIPRELIPLVQQQLSGLATQNFVWQGQVWPGQQMWWEISDNPESYPTQDDEPATQWQTRLKLDLPVLGDIDVTLRLSAGNTLAISVSTKKSASETILLENSQALREQLATAGLTLTQLHVDHGQTGK